MKQINATKLLLDYQLAQGDLDIKVVSAQQEVRSRLQSYIDSGIFLESDIAPLADKVVEDEKGRFQAQWGFLDKYIEEVPIGGLGAECESVDISEEKLSDGINCPTQLIENI